jgi:hypothetical protein
MRRSPFLILLAFLLCGGFASGTIGSDAIPSMISAAGDKDKRPTHGTSNERTPEALCKTEQVQRPDQLRVRQRDDGRIEVRCSPKQRWSIIDAGDDEAQIVRWLNVHK